MANVLQPSFRQDLWEGDIALDTDAVKILLVDTGHYTYSSAHDFRDDIIASAVIAKAGPLQNKTFTGGVFDSSDVTFTTVSGFTGEALVLFVSTGTASTSEYICFIDTATGLPITPNGGNITVNWAAAGIVSI